MIPGVAQSRILQLKWLKFLGIRYFSSQHSKLNQPLNLRWLVFYVHLDRQTLSNGSSSQSGDQASDRNL